MNFGSHLKSEIVLFVPGLNSNVSFCVVKKPSSFESPVNFDPAPSYLARKQQRREALLLVAAPVEQGRGLVHCRARTHLLEDQV